MMGEKDRARAEMAAAGLPVIPGSDGIVEGEDAARKDAAKIGSPSDPQGRRGRRRARHADGAQQAGLIGAFQTARSEAQQAFGTPDVYVEKLIEHPRHIEFQVLGDQHGKVIHLGERECRIQRRHQKVARGVAVAGDGRETARKKSARQVVGALEKIGYTNAGTVEFLMDEDWLDLTSSR